MDITRSFMSAAGGSAGRGINWSSQTTQDNAIRSVVCSPSGLFVGVGDHIVTSTDGITWTRQSIPYGDQYYKVIWDGSKFIAGGKSGLDTPVPFIKTSTDGVTWSTATIPSGIGQAVACIGGSGSTLIATFLYSSTVLVSSNGTTWTASGGTLPTSSRWQACTYNPVLGLYIVGRFSGAGNKVYTSPDATTWTARTCGSGSGANSLGFVYDINYIASTGYFLLSGFASDVSYDKIFSSPDGITWTQVYRSPYPTPLGCGVIAPTTQSSYSGAYITLFGGSSGTATSVWTSNGTSFTTTSISIGASPTSYAWSSTSNTYALVSGSTILYIDNLINSTGNPYNSFITRGLALDLVTSTASSSTAMVAAGTMPAYYTSSYSWLSSDSKASAYRSTDGVNWTPVNYLSSITPNVTTNVAYGAGVFVMVDSRGTVYSSSNDGATWVARTAVSTDYGVIPLVCWGGSVFSIISYYSGNGQSLYSYDGITWVSNFSSVVSGTGALTAITWDGTYFNAYNSNILARSSDAINWINLTPTGLPTSVKTVTYKAGLYVLGGNEVGGTGSLKNIFTSTDGIAWSYTTIPVTSIVDGVAVTSIYTDGFNFYAVASIGSYWWILSSSNGVDWTERTSYVTFDDSSLNSVVSNNINIVSQFGSSLYGFGRTIVSVKS